jgi:signal transduction histidine kinase
LRPYSLLLRITVVLTVMMVAAGICAFGWLYLKTKWVDASLRQETLLDQARVIASYLIVNENGLVELKLPPRLAEAYTSPESSYRYAVRDANGQFLFDAEPAVGPLPVLSKKKYKVYNYDPDGTGPFNISGAALQQIVGHRTFFVQVEQQSRNSDYLEAAVIDEFLTDGGWLGVLFMLLLLGASIWIVKYALAPLNRISHLAKTIGPANANIRLPTEKVPLEILPLVRSMNSVLDRLEQALQHQREFNANAAHQLRTPLAVLMANMDTLGNPEVVNRIRVDVEHMSRIVQQLLLDARLETAFLNLDEVVDLNGAAAEIAASFAPLALASNKTIELLRSDAPVSVHTNGFALREALGNLIENAINHTPAGTSVRIRVTSHPAIEVMDSGPGIPAEQRALIFERFWRADRNTSGAGLGLTIIDRIMKALNGSVRVDDCPGGGALFTLVFPTAATVIPERSSETAMT